MTRAPQQMRENLALNLINSTPLHLATDVIPVLLRMSSQMKEIASNKGEKVQPQVCVAGLSQWKFSVNDLQVQENCSHKPISGRDGCRFSDTGEKVQVTKLRAIMAKAVFNPKKN